ncbi:MULTISPECIES: hypothetical protein [unclassified Aureimonas]|uniref:hypothetical protein n=1 Tax=unclassified Aureimonas TaxID=2615206 RepID=UPI0007018DF8|nr:MULTISPECIES: hypothetical protein [unclassified Aureimonas]KQT52238.1 hypothetical protein ASG62_16400 [Aureimonas sp. Leaf427]KQT70528.1 hypothetical protein ASG54_21550 [Aureimonas sp. Leaf460]
MPGTDDSVERLRKDHTQLAATISVLTTEVGGIKTEKAIEKAVGVEREKNLDERLERIEKSLEGLYGLGKWMLLAFFGTLIAAVVTFMVKGGFNVPPTP